VAIGGSPPGPRPFDLREAIGNGTGIVAFDVATGQEKYRLSDQLASYATPIITTLDGQPVGLYFARGGLLGWNPRTGQELFFRPWRAKILESVNAANAVVYKNTILVNDCYDKGSLCVRWEKGQLTTVWANEKGDDPSLPAHWCTPIVVDGYAYGCGGRNLNDADLRCVDLATGEVQWIERRTTRCTLILVEGQLLSLGEQGELRRIQPNPKAYQELARWEVPGLGYPCWAPPALARGILYLRGQDDTRRDGHKLIGFDYRATKPGAQPALQTQESPKK